MQPVPITPAFASGQTVASLRAVYLQRLERLQRLRHQHEQELNRQGIRLLNRSVFAAYCACRDAGAEEEARDILGEASGNLAGPGQQPTVLEPQQEQPPAA